MIRFWCPHCFAAVRGQDGAAGRTLDCPGCGEPVIVPEPTPARSAAPGRGGKSGLAGIFIAIAAVVISILVLANSNLQSPEATGGSRAPARAAPAAWYVNRGPRIVTVGDWRRAPYPNRLATAADYALVAYQRKHGRIPDDLDELKPLAYGIERGITVAVQDGRADHLDCSEVAATLITLADF